MRKTLFVTLILCLTLIAPTWGEKGGSDGYGWEKLPSLEKGFYMAGFLTGHMVGFIDGQFYVGKRGKEIIYQEQIKEVDYYIKEFDAFLQTYPFCKKRELNFLMGQFSQVWFKTSPNTRQLTYKEINEMFCE